MRGWPAGDRLWEQGRRESAGLSPSLKTRSVTSQAEPPSDEADGRERVHLCARGL